MKTAIVLPFSLYQKEIKMNFRQRFEKFMYGRYGTDKLGLVLLWTALILMLINSFTVHGKRNDCPREVFS